MLFLFGFRTCSKVYRSDGIFIGEKLPFKNMNSLILAIVKFLSCIAD